ncbi:hypothetical protein ACRE_003500 [Hapsidospora chrysogenum ATCC 11550]|uniref:Chromo domain-containing protein n=1 Tax=Hapsidospora chrysogenum (strain ATCC 11550 / CBS 779.69 / DSM 880 / IAM 14645 / JCM 23072 / IMI 49137) TaxID=857340 RepID=A0A086THE7_HAPC1|nr:hypothetical protein ACRE_003500 [Hapsidospora chrysogenum ATCC 11550]
MASAPRSHASTPSTKPLRSETNKPKRGQLVVELIPKPRDYQPGSGPPLQRITLLPPRDSTAYIIERLLLPPNELAGDGRPRPKRMTYVVGWRDLPAASLLVPALDILEYVSPRELENWESALEEEINEDRARREEEKKANLPVTKGKRKRTGPLANAQIASAAAAGLETDEDSKGRFKSGALSLSTPQKRRMKDFDGLSGDEGSPTQQLERELYENPTAFQGQEEEEEEVDEVDMVDYQEDMDMDQDVTLHNPSVKEESEQPYAQAGQLENLPFAAQTNTSYLGGTVPRDDSPWASQSTSPTRAPARSHGELPTLPNTLAADPYTTSFTPVDVSAVRSALRSTQIASTVNWFTDTGTRSAPRTSSAPMSSSPRTASKSKRKTRRPKKPPKPPLAQQPVTKDGEEQWIVKRLEGDALYDVEGRGLVRYFKVRWEGDWPPEQNPTWEPEENIPPNMVRNYYKRGKDRRKEARRASISASPSTEKKGKKLTQTKLSWGDAKKYSSVSEVFAGGGDDELAGSHMQGMDDANHGRLGNGTQGGDHNDDDDEDEEEEFIVDEAWHARSQQQRPSWTGAAANLLGGV